MKKEEKKIAVKKSYKIVCEKFPSFCCFASFTFCSNGKEKNYEYSSMYSKDENFEDFDTVILY